MKTCRLSIIILVSVFFVAGICSLATAASRGTAPAVTAPAAAPVMQANPNLAVNPCPQGWHKIFTGGYGDFKCKPNKPQPVNCPTGTTWTDNSQTSCEVGCYYYIK